MTNNIDKIIARYLNLYDPEAVLEEDLKKIETALGIKLPSDLKILCKVFDGSLSIGPFTLFQISPKGPGWNIVDKTLEYRESLHLPKQYIALTEPDVSFVLLEGCQEDHVTSRVIMIDPIDYERFIKGQELEMMHRVFPSFTDFFEYLVQEEEAEREWANNKKSNLSTVKVVE